MDYHKAIEENVSPLGPQVLEMFIIFDDPCRCHIFYCDQYLPTNIFTERERRDRDVWLCRFHRPVVWEVFHGTAISITLILVIQL